MTGPEHFAEAERAIELASAWMSADVGWRADLTMQERAQLRATDLADAQVHATLAVAAAFAEVNPTSHWHQVAGTTVTE